MSTKIEVVMEISEAENTRKEDPTSENMMRRERNYEDDEKSTKQKQKEK